MKNGWAAYLLVPVLGLGLGMGCKKSSPAAAPAAPAPPANTATPTVNPSSTPTPTNTPVTIALPSFTPTPTFSPTFSPTPTVTLTATPSPTSTETSVPSATSTPTPLPTVDFCQLFSPAFITQSTGQNVGTIFGIIYHGGLTNTTLCPAPGVEGEVGYGPDGMDPSLWVNWYTMTCIGDVANDDNYSGTFDAPAMGTYDFCVRFRLNGGPWRYGDYDGTSNGYNPLNAGSMTVN